jgi:hypothetical protein
MLHELEHTASGALLGELPDGSFDRALASFLGTAQARLLAMYAGHRARFARFLVAELLPGAVSERDPATPWHVFWPVIPAAPIRIAVVCPRTPDPTAADEFGNAVWEIPSARPSIDRSDLPSPIDALVLARHEGADVQTGWTFRTVGTGQLHAGPLTAAQLDAHGMTETSAAQLPAALLGHLPALV